MANTKMREFIARVMEQCEKENRSFTNFIVTHITEYLDSQQHI